MNLIRIILVRMILSLILKCIFGFRSIFSSWRIFHLEEHPGSISEHVLLFEIIRRYRESK